MAIAELRTRGRRRASGFTIIELLVTLTIIAVLVAMAAPRLHVSKKMYVRQAAQMLIKDAELVRNRALSLKKVTRLQFNTATPNYLAYGDDNADGVLAATAAEQIFVHAFGTRLLQNGVIYGRGTATTGIPGEAGVGAVTFTSTRIDFDTRGLPTPFGTKGTVYLTSSTLNTAVFAVQMTASGSFRLWEFLPNGTWQ